MSTTSNSILSIVSSEDIEESIREANYALPLSLMLADTRAVGPHRGSVVQVPRMNAQVIPPGTKPENADFEVVESTMAHEQVTEGDVGVTFQISKKARMDAIKDSVIDHTLNFTRALRDRIDVEGFALVPGAAIDSLNPSDAFDDEAFITELATFQAVNPHIGPEGVALALTSFQLRDYRLDLQSLNGAMLGGDAVSTEAAKLFGPRAGYQGTRHGCHVFLSNNLNVAGNTADAVLMSIGRGVSPMAYRVWETLTIEDEYSSTSKSWKVTVSARFGWALVKDEELIRLQYAHTAA